VYECGRISPKRGDSYRERDGPVGLGGGEVYARESIDFDNVHNIILVYYVPTYYTARHNRIDILYSRGSGTGSRGF
jgi:hypothetical protein